MQFINQLFCKHFWTKQYIVLHSSRRKSKFSLYLCFWNLFILNLSVSMENSLAAETKRVNSYSTRRSIVWHKVSGRAQTQTSDTPTTCTSICQIAFFKFLYFQYTVLLSVDFLKVRLLDFQMSNKTIWPSATTNLVYYMYGCWVLDYRIALYGFVKPVVIHLRAK